MQHQDKLMCNVMQKQQEAQVDLVQELCQVTPSSHLVPFWAATEEAQLLFLFSKLMKLTTDGEIEVFLTTFNKTAETAQ